MGPLIYILIVKTNSFGLHNVCVEGVKNAVRSPEIETILADSTWRKHDPKIDKKFRAMLPGEIDEVLPTALKRHQKQGLDGISKDMTEGFAKIVKTLEDLTKELREIKHRAFKEDDENSLAFKISDMSDRILRLTVASAKVS
jgi:hypothetical protein